MITKALKSFSIILLFSAFTSNLLGQQTCQENRKKDQSKANTIISFAVGKAISFSPSQSITKKPKIYGIYTDPVKGKSGKKAPMKVLDKINAANPSDKFYAEWKKKIRLFDKKIFKGKVISTELKNDPTLIEDLKLDKLVVSGWSEFAGYDFYFMKPEITEVTGTAGESEALTITGKYFGVKPPKILVEYHDKKGKIKYKNCKIDKDELKYTTYKGKPSAMGWASGASHVVAIYPKLKDDDVATGYIILDNKCGLAAAKIGSSSGKLTLTMAVSPDSSGTTSPEVGSSEVDKDEAQTITATAATGYTFSSWTASDNATIADSTSETTTVTLTDDATVTANFETKSPVSFGGIVLAYATGTDKVQLDWPEATDSSGTSSSSFTYYVYQGTEDDEESVYQESNLIKTLTGTTELEVTGLTKETTYYFLVVAANPDGHKNEGNLLAKATTPATAIVVENEIIELDDVVTTTISVSDDETTVSFSGDYSSSIEKGDPIVVEVDTDHLLKKVTAISVSGGTTTLTVEKASLSEVIKEGDLIADTAISNIGALPNQSSVYFERRLRNDSRFARKTKPFWKKRAKRISEGYRAYVDPDGRFMITQKADDDDDIHVVAGEWYDVDASGFITENKFSMIVTPKIHIQAKWGWFSLNSLFVGMEFINLRSRGKWEWSGEKEIASGTLAEGNIVKREITLKYVVATGVPVHQTLGFSVDGKVTGGLKAKLNVKGDFYHYPSYIPSKYYATFSYDASAAEGNKYVYYYDKRIAKFTNDSLAISGAVGANLAMHLETSITTTFYGTATGSMTLDPSITMDAEVAIEPGYDPVLSLFDIYFDLKGWFEGKLDPFDLDLAAYKSEEYTNVAKDKFLTLPEISFELAPTKGDAGEDISFQIEVENGVNNDVDVNGTYNGEYNVTWSLKEETEDASITVKDDRRYATFNAKKDGEYTIVVTAMGDSFLKKYGTVRKTTTITIGEAGPVSFSDDNLKAVVQTAVDAVTGTSGTELTSINLQKITELDASGQAIDDLTGLEYCTGLTKLDLSNNEIPDSSVGISLLSSLTSLTELNFGRNSKITDISVLQNLTNLTVLKFGSNGSITDISSLAYLTKIDTLWIQTQELPSGAIKTVGGLTSLTYSLALTTITINGNKLSNISDLSTLTSVKNMNLTNNNISDLSGLSKLVNMETLGLKGNSLSALTSLGDGSQFTKMEGVYLTSCDSLVAQSSNISALTSMGTATTAGHLTEVWVDNSWKLKDGDYYADATIKALAAQGVKIGP